MSDWTGCSRATGICRRQHATKDQEIRYRQTKIEPLTREMAVLKRWRFGRSREQLDAGQASLLDETIDADIAAIEEELEQLAPSANADTPTRQQPKRAPLPPVLPRVELHHELGATTCTTPGCGCTLKRMGQDVSEKLDYTPMSVTSFSLLTFLSHFRFSVVFVIFVDDLTRNFLCTQNFSTYG